MVQRLHLWLMNPMLKLFKRPGHSDINIPWLHFESVASKIKFPLLLWELKRRALTRHKHGSNLFLWEKEWDAVWKTYCEKRLFREAELPEPLPGEFWEHYTFTRYFDLLFEKPPSTLTAASLAMLMVSGHLLKSLKLNVSRIDTKDLAKLFSYCPNVRAVKISSFSLSDIEALHELLKLRTLILQEAEGPVLFAGEVFLAGLKK